MPAIDILWIVRDPGYAANTIQEIVRKILPSELGVFATQYRHRWTEYHFSLYTSQAEALVDAENRILNIGK